MRERRKIVIADYDPWWPALFNEEKARILGVVGQWVAHIEHMGSTAVSGLGAKPVIDTLVGVYTLADADQHCIEPIQGLGYEYVPQYETDMPYRRFFRKDNAQGVRTHHIHLVEVGSEFWERILVFRDYLRAHRDAARAYEQLKRDLAPRFDDVNNYAQAKTEFIKATEAKAWSWKASIS